MIDERKSFFLSRPATEKGYGVRYQTKPAYIQITSLTTLNVSEITCKFCVCPIITIPYNISCVKCVAENVRMRNTSLRIWILAGEGQKLLYVVWLCVSVWCLLLLTKNYSSCFVVQLQKVVTPRGAAHCQRNQPLQGHNFICCSHTQNLLFSSDNCLQFLCD